ncbi:GvpL/GvpF family gas vesicle protein [Streptomyces sp. NPDC002530]
MAAGGVYVYAITRAGTKLPAGMGGVGSPPAVLRTVTEGCLDAVVSAAPPGLRARRRDLLAHQDVLMRLASEGPVMPMRFGMVAPDEEAVLAQLGETQAEHAAVLTEVSGRVEINIKALPAQNALADVVAEESDVRRLRETTRRRPGYEASLRLGEAVSAALTRRATSAGQRVLRELSPGARAVAKGPNVPGCALNVSFLVDRDSSEDFLAAARDLAEAHRAHVDLRVAGPLPCYSFVGPETRSPAMGRT